ncbi:MAG: metallophosphoesterase [Oscillospiraceae bacterium]|nr:metallophosphoesterase [Oscillospiraceae bacterium]
MNRQTINISRAAAAVAGTAAFIQWQNQGIRVTRYLFSHPAMPAGFKGFRIAHISDFHNYRPLCRKVAALTMAEKPDIIAITGDLFDCRKTDITTGFDLAGQLVTIAPVYYVRGNHEAKIKNTDNITDNLKKLGVNVIEDKKTVIERNGDFITLMGARDPQFYASDDNGEKAGRQFRSKMLAATQGDNTFKLLLSHRPEFIHTYRDSTINLALTGHAHGGQFGIPFTDYGVFVPNQGVFPPYAAGMKQLDDTTVIISRGIGNSVFPFRLFNRPEVVTVEFE